MSRFWELVVTSQGADRFYCFPFLLLFRMLTPVYQFFSRRHLRGRAKRRSRDWQAEVISIGSITVGGAGKTPIAAYLAGQLIARGKKVAIVHSGYGRRRTDDIIIGYGEGSKSSVAKVGDETAMLAGEVPQAAFAVGRDKKKLLVRVDRELHPDVVIIDDGYQRLDIAKELDIATVNAAFARKNRDRLLERQLHLFPRGILREPPASLARADTVFLVGTEAELSRIDEAVLGAAASRSIVRWVFSLGDAFCGDETVPLERLRARRPFLFAGIGSYDRLLGMVKDSAVPICGDYRFSDHFDYDKLDVDMLGRLSSAAGADCYLTTAKDLVKLPVEAFDKPVFCLRLDVRPLEEDRLRELLERKLS